MQGVAPEYRQLWNAIENGIISTFQGELRALGDVNRPMNSGLEWTPLCLAAYYGRNEMVSLLLNQYQAEVDKRLSMGATALFVACEHGKEDIVKLLLKAGADPDAACHTSGTTPLIKACEGNHARIVEIMLDGGASRNLAQADGSAPLFMAAQKGNAAVCRLLVARGADPDQAKLDSATPLIVAAELGNAAVVRFLVAEAGAKTANTPMYNGVTPLYKACEHGHFEIVKILVEQGGVDPDLPKNDGVSPLFTACQMGHLDIIRYLAEECGADVNKAKNDGVTPVYMAAEYRNVAIVEYLVAKDADLTKRSVNGLTALHAACIQHVPETVEVLLQAGADLEARDNGGFTPLCNACEWGRARIAALLLGFGADARAAGWNGNTGLHLAAWKGHIEIVQQFLGADADQYGTVSLASQKNHYGYTPLHLAALQGAHPAVRALLLRRRPAPAAAPATAAAGEGGGGGGGGEEGEGGGGGGEHRDLDAANVRGDGLLHCAVQSGSARTVAEICRHAGRLDPGKRNLLGMTALDLARQLYPPGDHRGALILKALEDAGVPRSGGGGGGPGAGGQPLAGGRIPAARFASVASRACPAIALENVKLLKKQVFMEAGEIPSYAACAENQWHSDATLITLGDKVLFVSHRYCSESHPDPTCEQYQLIKSFLSSVDGEGINYIWIDFSCVCQDRESELFGNHLANVPTALWCATHALVVPRVVPLAYNVAPDVRVPTTHLSDYLARGWCTLEAMAALLAGKELFCSFQVGSHISHEKFDRPEGAASSLGFFMSYIKVWNHLFQIQQEDMMNVNLNILEDQWRSVEPCGMLQLLLNISTNTDEDAQRLMIKAITLTLTEEDVATCNIPEVADLKNRMGICSVEQDKILVLNLMLFIGYYALNLPQMLEQLEEEEQEEIRGGGEEENNNNNGIPAPPSGPRFDTHPPIPPKEEGTT